MVKDLMEGSLWKLKSSLTGSTWKKHWVSCDGSEIHQYHSRAKPQPSEAPKYKLVLANCTIEDSTARKFCFKVVDLTSNTTLILATDDFDSYEQWLQLLVSTSSGKTHSDDHSATTLYEEENIEVERSDVSYEEKNPVGDAAPVDPVLEFFKKNDCCENSSNPCVVIRVVGEIIRQMDGAMNVSVVLRLLCRDFNTGMSGVLSHADFISWWESNASLRLINRKNMPAGVDRVEHNSIFGFDCPEAVHLAGFIDSSNLLSKDSHRSAFLSHLRLPMSDDLLDKLQAPEIDEVSDWNNAFQSSAESVYELSSRLLLYQHQQEEDEVALEEREGHGERRGDDAEGGYQAEDQSENQSVNQSEGGYTAQTSPSKNPSRIDASILTHETETESVQGQRQGSAHGNTSASPSRSSYIPAHSAVSRNSVPYNIQHSNTPSVRTTVTASEYSVPPLPADSPPNSPSIGSISSHSHSVAQSYKSHKSFKSLHTARSGISQQSSPRGAFPLPPLPEDNEHSEDYRSERSSILYPHSPEHVPVQSESELWMELLDSCANLAGVKGAFYRTAIDGVRNIIDEYSLPDEMKTATKLSADLVDTEGFQALSENANISALEVYALSGMIFSIAACPASTLDAPVNTAASSSSFTPEVTLSAEVGLVSTKHQNAASLERQALTSASDEVQHKIAGNEVRNTSLLQATIDALYAQGQLSHRIVSATSPSSSAAVVGSGSVGANNNLNIRSSASFFSSTMGFLTTLPDNISVDDSYDSRMPPPLPPGSAPASSTVAYHAPIKPTTLLTTVVDYAGFRVTVLCPTLIEETTTLVHGCSAVPVSHKHSDTAPEATINRTIQVRASQEVPLILNSLAVQLNISSYQRPHSVSYTRLSEMETEAELPMRNIDILSADLQMHDAADGRMYLLNLKNILPNALPRPHSYDVQTRQLRAEYVKALASPLKCDILQQTSPSASGVHIPEGVDARTDRLVIQEAGMNISACRDLFSTVLPEVAAALDNFASVPLDSFGLTQYLHSNGVNMRHMGVLYWLCTAPSVKQLLLSEALARCCKSILNAQLRAHARKTKGVVLRAQHRGRSIQHDYKEFVGTAMLSQKATVLELFNLTLGWGPASDGFWSVTLLDALNQKFGISATKAQLIARLHLPQLFIAMQYHTGTRFQDLPVYNLNTTVVVNPFNTQNIEEYFIPAAKVHLSVPGEAGQIFELADALIVNGMYKEAATAFKMRNVLQSMLFTEPDPLSSYRPKSAPSSHQMNAAHTIYKLALTQFLSGQLFLAHKTLRKYIARCARYHPVTARMLTLLMCVDFKLNSPLTAVQYFDAAQEIYTYTLGPNHPIICMHMNCLSEMYQSASAYQQARVLKLLAHVAAQKALGERHRFTAMLEYRLAAYYIEQQDHYSAMPLLENCVDVFNTGILEGGRFEYELSVCLYSLSMCASASGDVDRAGQLALKCVDFATKIDYKQHNYYPMVVSCYFLLSDLALMKNHGTGAIGLLEQCWMLLQQIPASYSQRKWAGDVMAVLVRRILSLLVASLPMTVRSLFDSVVSDWHKQQANEAAPFSSSPLRPARHTHDAFSPLSGIDDDITVSTAADFDYPQRAHAQVLMWERTCTSVFQAILKTSPAAYFEQTIQGIRERAVSGEDTMDSELPPELREGIQARISFAAQAAVISKLVHQSTEGGSHSFFQL